MSTVNRRKWDGILSLVWVSPGFLAFEFFGIEWWHFTDSTALAVLIVFGAWWGLGMLLAISGLKSGARISVIASLGTMLWFFCFLWSIRPRYHG